MAGGPTGPSLTRGASVERTWLDEASWVDVVRGWVRGADRLYDTLVAAVPWRQGRVFRYERWVDEPRLTAGYASVADAPDPVLVDAAKALRARYGVSFAGFSLNWYRDGRDSQAFHRDDDLRWLDDTLIALLVLGARRPFLVRPRSRRYAHDVPAGGATHDFAPGHGDLLVMGGRCQVGWEHAVPRAPGVAGGRISVQWRWTARTGRPVQHPSYRAPRTFSR
ncbi:MAG TPA: alpha-ketoglutarate-dependent dioxygenase AlkB [Acidimicrobiales bacterium]